MKLGENGKLKLFMEALLLCVLLVELFGRGGENGGAEVAGDGTRLAVASAATFVSECTGSVADVGVGSGAGTACVEVPFAELIVCRRFLLGCPFEYVLLDGTVGDGRYTFGLAIPVFI